MDKEQNDTSDSITKFQRIRQRILDFYTYCTTGVWRDSRRTWKVEAVKIINISVRSFMDRDLQSQACSMTYRTLLALVPALALILAIGRGFGFQELLQNQLYSYFPSQHTALQAAFAFVDSYLNQASEGVFVGVGIVFLLWTLISLLMSTEDSFNTIWNVQGRSIFRKITDYISILLVLPVLMICSAGLTLLMSKTLQHIIDVEFLRPAVDWMLDLGSLFFTALFFGGAYMLIPNTKVKFVNAFIVGGFVAIAFQILQWIFVSGQMYVTRYNAIYGSFSFLPLLLIWMQLVWLITLIGALLCYALQNVGLYNYFLDVKNISLSYRRKVILAVMAIIAKRFQEDLPPLTASDIAHKFDLPKSLVNKVISTLHSAELISFLKTDGDDPNYPIQPSTDVCNLTCGEIIMRIQKEGSSDFIPDFNDKFAATNEVCRKIASAMSEIADNIMITSLNIPFK